VKIVLTNDDGIDAPGLTALTNCVSGWASVVTVAPSQPQSGVGHRVTTRDSIRVDQLDQTTHRVWGTPADCTRLALKCFAPDADWIFAGINPGANLGSDVYNSGTVAAAREAAILGVPALAISQYIARDRRIDWAVTAHHARPILKMLVQQPLAPGHFWNINLPDPIEDAPDLAHAFCNLDINPHPYTFKREGRHYTYHGSIHDRRRTPGKDVAICFGGKIAISRVAVATTAFRASAASQL
jgi:5'-nucleotidase